MMIPIFPDFTNSIYQTVFSRYLVEHASDRFRLCETPAPDTVLVTDRSSDLPCSARFLISFQNDRTSPVASGANEHVLSPYQSMDVLLQQLQTYLPPPEVPKAAANDYSTVLPSSSVVEENIAGFDLNRHYSGMVTVYSPAGGCGKTTFAMALAQAAAQKYPSQKVLYWSLQNAQDWPLYYQNQSKLCISDLIYCMLTGDSMLLKEYLDTIAVGQDNGVFFVRPTQQIEDLLELPLTRLHELLALLTSAFDLVICDMDSSFDRLCKVLLRSSGKRYYVMSSLPGVHCKWQHFLSAIRTQNDPEVFLDEHSTMIYLCEKDHDRREISHLFTGTIITLPWCTRLFREVDGKLSFRQDNTYYERIQQLV